MRIVPKAVVNWMRQTMETYETASTPRKVLISLAMRYIPGDMTCTQFNRMIPDREEGVLTTWQQRCFDFHERACPMCQVHVQEYRATVELTRALKSDTSAEEADEVLQRILLRASTR